MRGPCNSKFNRMSTIEQTKVNVFNPKLEGIQEKRRFLSALSRDLGPMIEEGVYDTVNEALLDLYRQQEGTEATFNTFREWKEMGYSIKKGERAFLVWGRPKDAQRVETHPDESGEADEYKFFPLAFLFSSNQVEKKGGEQ